MKTKITIYYGLKQQQQQPTYTPYALEKKNEDEPTTNGEA